MVSYRKKIGIMFKGLTFPEQGRLRAVVESVSPEIDGGRFAIKRVVGEKVVVEADIFADGHDQLSAVLKVRAEHDAHWTEIPMQLQVDDRWRGDFTVTALGNYYYCVEVWVDHFESWRMDVEKKLAAGQNVTADLQSGAVLIEAAAQRASALDAEKLLTWANELRAGESVTGCSLVQCALDRNLLQLAARYSERRFVAIYDRELQVVVERERARYGAWYELFPRSFGGLKSCAEQLPRLAKLGFDVLYLPPIHPIGKKFRKGKNNSLACEPGDPGSPWAIGSSEGGHKAIHPELGTLEDFKNLVSRACALQIEIAMDIALQCSPEHPYVQEHPGWFRHRPDGSIRPAENPPKLYQDIYPFDFECDDWREMWAELKSIFDFWISLGVKIFRVDNPHTKTFIFWEWCIGELKADHPDLIFLAEAFTRPKPMRRLAKLGFTQSYNYFPWRTSKDELERYFTELAQPPVMEFFRPSLWPNTPDILPQYLQAGGRAAFAIRFVLAATLGATYGIYGPAFELCENKPRRDGAEEYDHSEIYEVRRWDLSAPQNLSDLIARVNQIRRENPALQSNQNLKFHHTDNPELIAYTKSTDDTSDTILTVVNLSPHFTHGGWLDLPLEEFRLDAQKTYQMHDLLTDARYLWRGGKNYIELNPEKSSAHIFRLRRHIRTEHDFEYFI